MSDGDATRATIAGLWHRVALERQRADRAAAIAARCEAGAAGAPARLRDTRLRMAALHRRTGERHLTSARLQALHAIRLQAWLDGTDPRAARPAFVAAVGAALGVPSVLITLHGTRAGVGVAAASDRTARAAHDAETVLGEGPSTTAVSSGALVVAGRQALPRRWPHYGAAMREAGVHSVLAVPLRPREGDCAGALCVLGAAPAVGGDLVAASDVVADALARAVLQPPHRPDGDDPLWLFEDTHFEDVVHQAIGMVTVRFGCGADDAFALLRARAFAEGALLGDVARRVVDDGHGLD